MQIRIVLRRFAAPQRCSEVVVGERPSLAHCARQVFHRNVARHAKPPRQPISKALVADIHRNGCSASVLVQTTQRLHELDWRQTDVRDGLADWSAAPRERRHDRQPKKQQAARQATSAANAQSKKPASRGSRECIRPRESARSSRQHTPEGTQDCPAPSIQRWSVESQRPTTEPRPARKDTSPPAYRPRRHREDKPPRTTAIDSREQSQSPELRA